MVFTPSTYLLSATVALMALHMQETAASSLEYDLYTTCTSYDIGDDNFPGRGTEIIDDGTCTVTVPKDPNQPTNRKLEWVSGDDIADLEAYFGTTLELKLKNLSTSAVYTPSPWAGSNWPTYQDSIDFEWNKGEASPAEKYATAFGLDVKTFMNRVLQSRCGYCLRKAFRPKSGFCIPTWYGICHAWAPAAISEKEPNCAVTHNSVTFQPMDVKALITDVYYDANISSVFTGSRYAGCNDSIDEYGSHTDYSYRDLNPGYFHVASANLLGLLNTTFIIDREAGTEVWNQPVVGFEVYEQTLVHVKSYLTWINTDDGLVSSGENEDTVRGNYTYLLELNDKEEIIGGEWLDESNDNHPDFLWFAKSKPASDIVMCIGLSYANVTMLLEMAVKCTGSDSLQETKARLTA